MGFVTQVLGERREVSVGRSIEQEKLPDCERGCSKKGSAAVLGTGGSLYPNRILLAGGFMHVPDGELGRGGEGGLKRSDCQHDTPNTTTSGVGYLLSMRRRRALIGYIKE